MRARVRFSKLGKVRFTSHRDLARVFERAMRKAMIEVAYSDGFTPRPKVSFGLALPTGAESVAEYLDMELVADATPGELTGRLNAVLPRGFSVTMIERIERADVSLQQDVIACAWSIGLVGVTAAEAAAAASRVLGAETFVLERSRKGEVRRDDVRPAIESLSVTTDSSVDSVSADSVSGESVSGESVSGGVTMQAVLATRARGLRPTELLMVCFPDRDPLDVGGRVLRTCQWIERDGARWELLPLPDAAVLTPTTEVVGV